MSARNEAGETEMKPAIVTCAVTGGIHTPAMSPHLPVRPEHIARESIGAADAGAAILHLHARDPETGKPSPRAEDFRAYLKDIRHPSDPIINISTGGGLGMSLDDRLEAANIFQPEMVSLNMGSMNFGIFPMAARQHQWKYDWEKPFLEGTRDLVFKNTFSDIERTVSELSGAFGTRFEMECYDVGHLYTAAFMLDAGVISRPPFIQMIFGILGGIGAELRNLHFMYETAVDLFGDEFEWSVLGAGRHQFNFATQALLLGGNVRVGLEDNLYLEKGELAKTNAQQVRKISQIAASLGREIATPDETRARLGLKGSKNAALA